MLGGRVYRGATGAAGELGHTLVGADFGRRRAAGRAGSRSPARSSRWPPGGCWTAWRRRSPSRSPSSALGKLAAAWRGGRRPRRGRGGAGRRPRGDRGAPHCSASGSGSGSPTRINTFDPDEVVVGGGVSVARASCCSARPREVARRFALPGVGERTEIRLARHGSQAGVRGAALLAGLELAGGEEGVHRPAAARWSERERSVQTAPENPFAQDVERADSRIPTTLVIFGAGGDLAARKLLPAVYNLSLAGLLPDRFGVIGVSRRRRRALRSASTAREAIEAHSRTGFDEDAWKALEPKLEFLQGDFGEPGAVQGPGGAPRTRRRPPGRAPSASSTWPSLRSFFAQIAKGAGGGRAGRRRRSADPADDREAVRARPRIGAGAERRGGLGVRRVAGVPPRPLPRQGDGAEPPGAAVRQRHPRADLEPSLRRPRPDHRGRGSRDRPPRRLLRLGGRDSRRDPEPRSCSCSPWWAMEAAGALRRRHDPRREGEAPALRAPLRAGRGPRLRGPRPVRRRAGSAGRRSRPTWTRRASPTTRGPRPTSRCGWRSTTGAGRERRSTSAPASGCRAG